MITLLRVFSLLFLSLTNIEAMEKEEELNTTKENLPVAHQAN
jgi:hypothetical protein